MRLLANIFGGKMCAGTPGLVVLGVLLAIATFVTLTGCGFSGSAGAFTPSTIVEGSVYGGRGIVTGAQIQLYAAGTKGNGSAAVPLLRSPIQSDSEGKFSIPANYECPSTSSQLFVVARGGNPGRSSSGNNAIALMAMLGSCNQLSDAPIAVNEVTTVGSVWPLAQYMTSPTNVGSAAGDTAFLSAVSSVPEFIDLSQGSSPGTPQGSTYFADSSKLYTLADVLAHCAGSSGGTAGDGSACGLLFSVATPPGGRTPSDTITAAINVALNPETNVAAIYGLVAGETPFQPTLQAAPPDWTLTLSTQVATPAISLTTGTYTGPQQVTISDSTAASIIHYTLDGTVPTTSSSSYAGPISISATSMVQAIAVLNGSESPVASSALTIAAQSIASRLVYVQQPSSTRAGGTITPAVRVAMEDARGNVVTSARNQVTLSLAGGNGLQGTLTATAQNGIATFSNLSVSTAGSGDTLLASSPKLTAATSTSFTISASSSPAKLAFSQQPSNTQAGSAITPAVQVAVEDANGNVVT
ncbi:MAG: chitobiase/beta-hexosaminidase C-terminal domain-containing protein, partial [Acidobacteriaceae bacterium]